MTKIRDSVSVIQEANFTKRKIPTLTAHKIKVRNNHHKKTLEIIGNNRET